MLSYAPSLSPLGLPCVPLPGWAVLLVSYMPLAAFLCLGRRRPLAATVSSQ
jgi:hypothetical protein